MLTSTASSINFTRPRYTRSNSDTPANLQSRPIRERQDSKFEGGSRSPKNRLSDGGRAVSVESSRDSNVSSPPAAAPLNASAPPASTPNRMGPCSRPSTSYKSRDQPSSDRAMSSPSVAQFFLGSDADAISQMVSNDSLTSAPRRKPPPPPPLPIQHRHFDDREQKLPASQSAGIESREILAVLEKLCAKIDSLERRLDAATVVR